MQVPAQVEYEKAASVVHALSLLARYGPEARILAGGHSLIPMMKLRLAQPETLIDINGLSELSYLEVADGALRIGALTRHAQLLDSASAARYFAILHDAEKVIADPVVRNWGTVGGSLCQADPSEDLSAAFAALKASMVIRGQEGSRTVPAREFHTGPYETVVAADEMLTEIRIQITPGGGSAYEKVGRRVGDWPVGAAGAAIWLAGDTVEDAGIGLTAVGARQFAAPEAEEFLRGAPATEESFARAGEIAAEHCRPVSDQRGRPSTSGIWPPSSPCVRCAGRGAGRGARTPDVQITVTVNGAAFTRDVEPRLLLIHFLRDHLGLTGSHWGCDTSNCGACVVWLDETPVKSCTVLAAMADGHRVLTVEGMERAGRLDPVQEGFAQCHGLQCGFCTPGMMLTARWLLDHNPDPSPAQIREALSGQVCRCTGYENIVRSVRWAAQQQGGDGHGGHRLAPGGSE